MPITGWNCPVCHRFGLPLDHFETTNCGLSIHPDYAQAVLHGNDDRYTQEGVTVTSGIGCPRSRAIEESEPVSVNPLDYNALLIGSAWDRYLAQFAPESARKLVVRGEIAGVAVSGEIDRLRTVGQYLCIEDHKHGNNYQYKFVKEEGPKIEAKIQTSLYAELLGQMGGPRPTHGVLWYHFSGANKQHQPPVMAFVYLLMALEECLAHKPFGGDYTVEQLLKQTARYEAGKTDRGVRLSALELPLAGETMSFGSASYCDYCQVREVCFTAAKGAPF